jgi:RNase adaptor protein for sRNA GlmZ degradation
MKRVAWAEEKTLSLNGSGGRYRTALVKQQLKELFESHVQGGIQVKHR